MTNLSKEIVLSAIENIDKQPELRRGRESIEYDLIYDGRKYPPILVLSEANKLAGGKELMLSDFGNSTKRAFEILTSLGFEIDKKYTQFYPQLKKFLLQTATDELKTKDYVQNYLGLKVEVSFGKGNQAKIPWIAFLGGNNTVQNGIYPVYLFFKSRQLLILAYGISETNKPSSTWSIKNGTKISEFFLQNYSVPPERYGDSFVFATYDTSKQLDANVINDDLEQLLKIYKSVLNQKPYALSESIQKFQYRSFSESLNDAGLIINEKLCLRFVASLLTKPFVILTGLAGSGKTKLALSFAKWITNNESQICLVPVGADWTNREPLLGFPNTLDAGRYILPDNGALSLLIEANKPENKQKPYFLILDEMNLSHVERYFADFLSAMESSEAIHLHPKSENWKDEVPQSIKLPPNLFVIGTVNIDETTYMFSPKVLDRSSVIEFRVTKEEIQSYLIQNKKVDLDLLSGKGALTSKSFVDFATVKEAALVDTKKLNEALLIFFEELKKLGAEFGYRTASEIRRFFAISKKLEPALTEEEIIDAAVMQKLLPKIHGSRRKLEPVLKALGELCLNENKNIEEVFKIENTESMLSSVNYRYPICLEKILRMQNALINNGFTSYAEA